MKVLSLFTGAGGLDLGLERAGFEIVGCVEANRDCQETLRRNRPEWKLLEPGDIHAHRPGDILAAFGLKKRGPTLLAGGPPCQPFSKSGQWKYGRARRMSDPRAATLRAYLDVLEAALPEAMLLENVRGIAATRQRVTHKYEALDVLRASLRRINRRHGTAYEPFALVIDAAAYGVPQRRERVFVYAARDASVMNAPLATHGEAASQGGLFRFANTWDALAEYDDPEFDPSLLPGGVWGDLLPSIPEGANYSHHTPRGGGEPLFGWRTKYWSFLLKLARNRPSWTIQAQAGPATGPFHWRSRRLMTRELAALQCFPDDWEIHGSTTSARRQLGNAVPPPIGELLGLEILRQLLGETPPHPVSSLTPTLRDDCTDPEHVAEVPAKYLYLRGDHPCHPGPGLGPGALKRLEEQLEQAA
ncbi:MAG: DNA cytosine methyltransferase [Chloroflexi bacterium]|nr:MAG: DNA cytosine methyltransferase [Chloroflexota bacterium]